MYDYNFTQLADLGYEKAMAYEEEVKKNSILPCYKRQFNLSQYVSTVAIEWDLVCERRVLYSTTQAASQAGKFIGYFFMGYLHDT
ncbi:hypothetical protein SK128_027413, partial [Halocaridina rubra]